MTQQYMYPSPLYSSRRQDDPDDLAMPRSFAAGLSEEGFMQRVPEEIPDGRNSGMGVAAVLVATLFMWIGAAIWWLV
jgi:hypothetical protein